MAAFAGVSPAALTTMSMVLAMGGSSAKEAGPAASNAAWALYFDGEACISTESVRTEVNALVGTVQTSSAGAVRVMVQIRRQASSGGWSADARLCEAHAAPRVLMFETCERLRDALPIILTELIKAHFVAEDNAEAEEPALCVETPKTATATIAHLPTTRTIFRSEDIGDSKPNPLTSVFDLAIVAGKGETPGGIGIGLSLGLTGRLVPPTKALTVSFDPVVSARLIVWYPSAVLVEARSSETTFHSAIVSALACPIVLSSVGVAAMACVGLEGGLRAVSSSGFQEIRDTVRPQVGATGELRTLIAASDTLHLDVRLGFTRHFLDDRFVYETSASDVVVVFHPDPLAFRLTLGMAFRINE